MNWAFWFMILQIITCLGGAIGFAALKNYPIAWVWLMYSSANIGFAYAAWRA